MKKKVKQSISQKKLILQEDSSRSGINIKICPNSNNLDLFKIVDFGRLSMFNVSII